MNWWQELAGEAALYGIAYWILHGQMIEGQVTQQEFEMPEIEIMPIDLRWDDVSIREMRTIAENLAEHASQAKTLTS